MNGRHRYHWRHAALSGLVLASFTLPGHASHRNYVINVLDTGATAGGVFVAVGDVNEGVIFHEGALSALDCLEFAEARNGMHALFARAAGVGDGPNRYLRVVDVADGVGSAMGGISDRQTSPDHCGAGGVPALNGYATLTMNGTAF